MKALRVVYEKGGVVLAFVDFVAFVVVGVVGGDDGCDDKGQKENENEMSVGSCHMLTRKIESETSKANRGDESRRRDERSTIFPFLEGDAPWEFYQPIPCHVIAPVT